MQERVELAGYKGIWNVTLCKVKQVETLMSVPFKGVNKSFLKKQKIKFRKTASNDAPKLRCRLAYILLRTRIGQYKIIFTWLPYSRVTAFYEIFKIKIYGNCVAVEQPRF